MRQERRQIAEQSPHSSGLSAPNSHGQTLSPSTMKKVYLSSYGCQMNANDSERMLSLLDMLNYQEVRAPEQADLILINSCAIREKPVHKVHSEVGRYRKLKAQQPSLKIGVAGCVAQQEKSQLLKDIPLIDFVFGPDSIDELPEILQRVERQQSVVQTQFDYLKPYHIETMVRNPGVSTFVNITKGCDNFCTFCIVPFTRGRERSRPLKQVVQDVERLVQRGVREVTLLGQNVNSYKSECGANFAQLLVALAEQTAIQRIRFTTSHPQDFDESLVDIMAAYREKIMDYIHLPVQSGNSDILRLMNRGYTREEYIAKAEMILRKLPGAILSTDVIVGFPQESEAQFQDTMTLLDQVPFENVYAFAYSSRPLTKAAKMSGQVDEAVKSRRLNVLLNKHKDLATSYVQRYHSQVLQILVENEDLEKGCLSGRSTQNKLVHFHGSRDLIGKTVAVKIVEAHPLILRGEHIPI